MNSYQRTNRQNTVAEKGECLVQWGSVADDDGSVHVHTCRRYKGHSTRAGHRCNCGIQIVPKRILGLGRKGA